MTFNDFFVQQEFQYRTERARRAIRSRDGGRARAAWLRKRAGKERAR